MSIMRSLQACAFGITFAFVGTSAIRFAPAQDQLRTWGSVAMDTHAFREQVRSVFSSVNQDQAIVLTQDGRLLGFGHNADGGAIPPSPPPGLHFTHVAASGVKVAALNNGQLVQWSAFWNGFTPPSQPPVLPAGLSWVELASTQFRAFALRSDGVLESWGTTWGGIDAVPVLASGLQYTSVSGSTYFVAAIVSDGSVRIWGLNPYGIQSIPGLPAGVQYTKIRAGQAHVLALRSDGQVVAWGANLTGQCAVPALPPGLTYVDVMAGNGHSLALRSDGQWVAWGANNQGQCNIPSVSQIPITSVACGYEQTIALRADGLVESFGIWPTASPLASGVTYHDLDAIGDGALVLHTDGTLQPVLSSYFYWQSVPALPAGVHHVAASSGFDFWLSLGSDGLARAWGSNYWGQLVVPPLPAGVVYTKVAAGSQSAAALRSNGTAVAWGLNSFGQIAIPALPPGQSYTDLAVGLHNVLLARSDGSLVISGLTTTGAAVLPSLPAGRRAIAVACGFTIAAALLDDGSIVSWGGYAPVVPPLPPGLSYVEVDCGLDHAIARRSDGVVVTWGLAAQATTVPTPGPGRSFLRIAAAMEGSSGLIGTASHYVPIGPGCAGSRPAARLVPRDTPLLGRTLPIAVTNLPIDVAFVAFGWSATPGPISLAGVGMPGCAIHTSIDTLVGLLGSGGEALLQIPVPMQPSLRGVQFFNQAVVLDPAAGNSWNAVVSEAMAGQVGG